MLKILFYCIILLDIWKCLQFLLQFVPILLLFLTAGHVPLYLTPTMCSYRNHPSTAPRVFSRINDFFIYTPVTIKSE